MICQDPTNFLLYGNRNLSMEKSPLDEFPIKWWEWLLVTRGYHCQLLEIHSPGSTKSTHYPTTSAPLAASPASSTTAPTSSLTTTSLGFFGRDVPATAFGLISQLHLVFLDINLAIPIQVFKRFLCQKHPRSSFT